MCCYLVLEIDPMARWLRLQDGYGRHHIARVATTAPAIAAGDELHGAQPALGPHFLSGARSGYRLRVHFEFIRVSRQEIAERLNPTYQHDPAAAHTRATVPAAAHRR